LTTNTEMFLKGKLKTELDTTDSASKSGSPSENNLFDQPQQRV